MNSSALNLNPNNPVLLVDGSVNPQSGIGCGACWFIPAIPISTFLHAANTGNPSALAKKLLRSYPIKTQRFIHTSSTQLELEALLWALHTAPVNAAPINVTPTNVAPTNTAHTNAAATNTDQSNTNLSVLTDCQNIIRLPQRQARLQAAQYRNKKGEQLALASLYKQFYAQYATQRIALIKVKGHVAHQQKTPLDTLFSMVDHHARSTCRQWNLTR